MTVDDFLSRSRGDGPADYIFFEQLPFEQPLYILFSSGTSGPPKCIVHSAGVSLQLELYAQTFTYQRNTNVGGAPPGHEG